MPTTIKSQEVKIVITWSICPDDKAIILDWFIKAIILDWFIGLQTFHLVLAHLIKCNSSVVLVVYGKCSKILNTSCLPKSPRQTDQTASEEKF